MRFFRLFLGLLVLSLMPFSARAIEEEFTSDGETRTLADYIEQFVDVPEGATDWKVLGKTKEVSVSGKTEDGFDFAYIVPEFTPDVRALDGQVITLKGFMFPLEEDEAQSLFLFGPFPVSCPFHYHVGPSLMVEVHTQKGKAVPFNYDPIVVEGRLELVEKDLDTGIFYRLKEARQK